MTAKQTTWVFTKDGVDTEIPLERWAWRVMYKDGTELNQFDKEEYEAGKSRFHQIGEVDMANVAVFEMVNTEDTSKRFSIVASEDITKFITFIRRSILNAATKFEKRFPIYCFGYVVKGVSVYHFILPDDRMVVTTDRNMKLIST